MEIIEALKTALENEIAGEEFYKKTANEAKDEFSKSTFNHLAKDELVHISRIKEFIKDEKASEIEDEIKNRNPKSGLNFFRLSEEKFKETGDKFEGDFKAYEFAIGLEKKSYEFYKELFEKTEDAVAKEFFKFLMKEEKVHKKILEEALDFLKDPEDYFLDTEKWHFD